MQSRGTSKAALVIAGMWTLTACSTMQRGTTVESGGDVAPSVSPVMPSSNAAIPAGVRLNTTLDQSLGTSISKAGDVFSATVSNALYATNGSLVVPAGAKIEGRVTALDDSDNATEPALIRLTFDRIRIDGKSYPLSAAIVESNAVKTSNQSETERTRQIVIGGAVGAALGGLLSKGDLDKIIIGGALGAAAGSIISLGTEVNATLPAGSAMTVQLTETTSLR